jgi:hypothetical protein
MTERFAYLTSWDCERESEGLSRRRGTSIVDLAIGSVAALGQRQLRNREFQVPDIVYFLAIC